MERCSFFLEKIIRRDYFVKILNWILLPAITITIENKIAKGKSKVQSDYQFFYTNSAFSPLLQCSSLDCGAEPMKRICHSKVCCGNLPQFLES